MKPTLVLIAAAIAASGCKRTETAAYGTPIQAASPVLSVGTPAASPYPPALQKPVPDEEIARIPDLYETLRSYRHPKQATIGPFSFTLDGAVDEQRHTADFMLAMQYHGETLLSEPVKVRYVTCGASLKDKRGWTAECFVPPKIILLDGPFVPGERLASSFTMNNANIQPGVGYYSLHADLFVPGQESGTVGVILRP